MALGTGGMYCTDGIFFTNELSTNGQILYGEDADLAGSYVELRILMYLRKLPYFPYYWCSL